MMNEKTLADFEDWANQYKWSFDLSKRPAMKTENPYADSKTWKAYEAWCSSKENYCAA